MAARDPLAEVRGPLSSICPKCDCRHLIPRAKVHSLLKAFLVEWSVKMRWTKTQTISSSLVAAAFVILAMAPWADANASCGAFVNCRPMTGNWCRIAIQTYGYVQPGRYVADGHGNWFNLDTGQSGNIYRDSQNPGRRSGSGDGGGGRWTSSTIDPSGGCEGGSCVNILD